MEGKGDAAAVGMTVVAMATLLPAELEAVIVERGSEPASSGGANNPRSYRDGNHCLVHFCHTGRQRFAVL
jgi:hypothetical protein